MYVVPFDIDCDECGYNLRGLPRPEVVCPECGHVAEFGALLERHLHRLGAVEADRPARRQRLVDSFELGARISAWAGTFLVIAGIASAADSWFKENLGTPLLLSGLLGCLIGGSIYHARTQNCS